MDRTLAGSSADPLRSGLDEESLRVAKVGSKRLSLERFKRSDGEVIMARSDDKSGPSVPCTEVLFAAWNVQHQRGIRLPELLYELDQYSGKLSLKLLSHWLKRLIVHPDDLRDFLRFNSLQYQRNQIHIRPNYEALLLCWLPEQFSPIHDHGESNCALAVLAGELVELSYLWNTKKYLRANSFQRVAAGGVLGSSGPDLHQVANWSNSGCPLVTLHLYSPPLQNMKTYPETCVTPVPADQLAPDHDLMSPGILESIRKSE